MMNKKKFYTVFERELDNLLYEYALGDVNIIQLTVPDDFSESWLNHDLLNCVEDYQVINGEIFLIIGVCFLNSEINLRNIENNKNNSLLEQEYWRGRL